MLCRKKRHIWFWTVCLPAKHSGKLEKAAFLPNKLQNKSPHWDVSPSQTTNQVFECDSHRPCTDPRSGALRGRLLRSTHHITSSHTSSRDGCRGSAVSGRMKGLLVAWAGALTPHIVPVGVVHLFDPAVAERQFPHPVHAAVHARAQAQVCTGTGAVEAICWEVVRAGRRQGERSV